MTRIVRLLPVFLLAGAAAAATDAPVVFNGRTLFTIHAGVGAFPPQARARALEQRLDSLSQNAAARGGRLTLSEREGSTDIRAGDLILLSVTSEDARAAGRARPDLAAQYAATLEAALRESRRQHGFTALAEAIGLAVLLTVLFAGILRLLRLGCNRLRLFLQTGHGTRIRAIRLQRLELLTAGRVAWILAGAVTAFEAAAVLLALYFYLSLVLSVFPATRGLSNALLAWLESGLQGAGAAIASYGPNLVLIVLVALLTRLALKVTRYLFHGIENGMLVVPGFYGEWSTPTYKIVRFLILAIAAVVIFPYIPGHDSPALRGLSIFFGVLFSLGSAGAVGNLVAGLLLTYTRAFQVGDRVRIADTLGDVVETSLLATHIRTIKNEDVTVPNSLVLSSHIVNFSSCCRGGALVLHTTVTIGYDAPWRDVHRLLIAAALATEGILKDPPPFVLQTALDDFYVSYQINAYTARPSQIPAIYSGLHQNIQDEFNRAGVEICSPHFSAMRDGNRITIPEEHIPKTYNPPAFRFFAAGRARTESAGE